VGSTNYDQRYARKIERLVSDLRLAGRIKRVTHYISRKELIAYLVAADVLIFPNERQTWGLIAIEAMAAGKPVIVSDETGVHEIIREKYNGLVFKARKVTALYREMQWLYDHPEQAKQIGRRARKEVLKRYSWEHYTREMEQVFNDSGQPSI
jgi:glycosyltransferase involved in cell wall biosynthesis